MKRNIYSLFIFFFLMSPFVLKAFEDPKEQIVHYESKLKNNLSPEERAKMMVKLARLHVRDQEVERGVRVFLEAVEIPGKPLATKVSVEERKLYQEALGEYLKGENPLETAQVILKKYAPIMQEHPDYYLLNYFIAASYANMGLFDRFFETFALSYRHHPNDFMAFKAKAVLHLILHAKSTTDIERSTQMRSVYSNAVKANELNTQDVSLYKLRILYSDVPQKSEEVKSALKKIMDRNIIIPRSDILFYTHEAVVIGDRELARNFVAKAKGWYQYSRIIKSAEEMVDKMAAVN